MNAHISQFMCMAHGRERERESDCLMRVVQCTINRFSSDAHFQMGASAAFSLSRSVQFHVVAEIYTIIIVHIVDRIIAICPWREDG